MDEADALMAAGRYGAAFEGYAAVLDRHPEDRRSLVGLATCLALRPSLGGRLRSPEHVIASLRADDIDPLLVAPAAAALVLRFPEPLGDDVLLPLLLRRAPVLDLRLERLLTAERRRLCLSPPVTAPALAGAIAEQTALNEQAWSVSAEEESALDGTADWVRAMYLPDAPDGAVPTWHRNPPESAIGSRGGRRGMSDAVRVLYEEHPYPRWQRLTRREAADLGEHLRQLGDGSWTPPLDLRAPRILSLGCGTGRDLLSAVAAWAPREAIGIDLSGTSLAHAGRMAQRLGLDVTLCQADLLDLDDWDERFDVVVCTGVLHHLIDPLAGWRIAARLLRPGGVMLVGLYSEVARRGVAAAQQQVRSLGLPPTTAGIREARAHLSSLPDDHPARECALLGDFYTVSGCRDLLFHVHERHMTLRGIAADLAALDLAFLGFELDPAVRHLQRTLFAGDGSLEAWAAFERLFPRTFLGMYQFWCQRPDDDLQPLA